MYDLDYDAAMLELLRMFLTFLSGLVLASCMVILTWYLLLRAFLRSFPVDAARPRRQVRSSEIPARQRLFVVTRRA
ncbi:hypothetical protein [Alistipes finegoldii]|jgi:hypothetical protein|uniref:hypothetical protein n=1 Tax=Alistipes finegoldii TaxID=214856 RepID=UPI00243015D4|nr:hypothetical protein [Alistipes finegoldii]